MDPFTSLLAKLCNESLNGTKTKSAASLQRRRGRGGRVASIRGTVIGVEAIAASFTLKGSMSFFGPSFV